MRKAGATPLFLTMIEYNLGLLIIATFVAIAFMVMWQ